LRPSKVLSSSVHGRTVKEWARLLTSADDDGIEKALKNRLPVDWGKKLVK